MGKGKDSSASQREAHVPRPISSLRDPSSFAPPPKRANTAGAASYTPPISPNQHVNEPECTRPAPPPVPYRADTTGLATNRFPTPPARRNESSGMISGENTKPRPSLPPRLPPRASCNASPPPPPPYELTQGSTDSYLNQGAVSRLANAGVSVPALGIQRNNSTTPGLAQSSTGLNPTNELQARFSRLNTSSSTPVSSGQSPIQGMSAQQFQTAASAASHVASQPAVQQAVVNHISSNGQAHGEAHPPPPPPTRTDSLRERHSEQIESVRGKLNGLNQKYGITKRINDFIEDQKSPAHPNSQHPSPPPPPPPPAHPVTTPPAGPNYPYTSPNTSRPDLEALNKRKPPPPPPPPKKPSMHSRPVNQSPSPPPLPLNTKPR